MILRSSSLERDRRARNNVRTLLQKPECVGLKWYMSKMVFCTATAG